MSLQVGYEHYEGGVWKHMVLKNPTNYAWKKIAVGDANFKLVGQQPDICKWLIKTKLRIVCGEGYGNKVRMVCNGFMPGWRDAYLEAVINAAGTGGGVLTVAGAAVAQTLTAAGAAEAGASAGNVVSGAGSAVDTGESWLLKKLFGKKVSVTFAPAMAPHGRAATPQFTAPFVTEVSGMPAWYYGYKLSNMSSGKSGDHSGRG